MISFRSNKFCFCFVVDEAECCVMKSSQGHDDSKKNKIYNSNKIRR